MPAQSKIIPAINRLLKNRELSFRLNKTGVCAALSSKFIEKFLENKEDDLFELLRHTTHLPDSFKLGDDLSINQLIPNLEICHRPDRYLEGIWQGDLENFVKIEDELVRCEFSLGLVDSKDEWVNIFEKIRKDGRAAMVGSHNHAVALGFKNGQFIIYDPNYDEDEEDPTKVANVKCFNTAEEAVNEFIRIFHYVKDQPFGLGVRIFANPKCPLEDYSKLKQEIIDARLQSDADLNRSLTIDGKARDSLFYAIQNNDEEVMQQYLDKGAVKLRDAKLAICTQRQTLPLAYFKTTHQLERVELIQQAAASGTSHLMEEMIKFYEASHIHSPEEEELFRTLLQRAPSLLEAAIESNRVEKVRFCLELYEKYRVTINGIENFKAAQILKQVTEKGSGEILSLLTKDNLLKYSQASVLENLKLAALNDQGATLQFWLTRLEGTEIKTGFFNEDSLANISLLNMRKLIDAGFKVDSNSLIHALKRRDIEFYHLALSTLKPSPWLTTLLAVEQDEIIPGNLFKEENNLTLFQLLTRLHKNKCIKDNWPSIVSKEQGESALQYACEIGNIEIATFLAGKGYQLKPDVQVNLLTQANDEGEKSIIKAVAAAGIDGSLIISIDEKIQDLLFEVMELGEINFLIEAWNGLDKNKKRFFLNFALFYQDNLFNYLVIHDEPAVKEFLRHSIHNAEKNPSLIKINRLATKLKPAILTPIWDKTKQDKWEFLLKQSLLNEQITLAESLIAATKVLDNDKICDLMIEASKSRKSQMLSFLVKHYGPQVANDDFVMRLQSAGNYSLLAELAPVATSLTEVTKQNLLIYALNNNQTKIIQALSSLIQSDSSYLSKALESNYVSQTILLLMHQTQIDEVHYVPLIQLIVNNKDEELLYWVFKNDQFVEFLSNNCAANLEKLDANPAFDILLRHAIIQNDVSLFKKLKTFDAFSATDKKPLFELACEHQSILVANELLSERMDFDDRNEVKTNLDQLFAKNSSEPSTSRAPKHLGAHEIYQLIREHSLKRLYDFLKTFKYQAFSSLHSSIYEMLPDVKGPLKQNLLLNALNDKNGEALRKLLEQTEVSDLEPNGLEFFKQSVDDETSLRILLDHYQSRYSLQSIVEAALNKEAWPLVFALLKMSHSEDLDELFIARLKEHAEAIFNLVEVEANAQIALDPRHRLNQLLYAKTPLADVLVEKKSAIEELIESIQEDMITNQIDLKKVHYRFDLKKSINKLELLIDQLEEEIQPVLEKTDEDILASADSRKVLKTFRDQLTHHELPTSYFEQGERLEALFSAYDDRFQEKRNNFKSIFTNYRTVRKEGSRTHHLIPFFQFTKEEKLDAVNHVIASLDSHGYITHKDKKALKNGSLFKSIDNYIKQTDNSVDEILNASPIKTVDEMVDFLNRRDIVQTLISLLNQYKTDREGKDEVYHFRIFKQFTRTEKIEAVNNLIAKLNDPHAIITVDNIKALKQGSLNQLLSEFLKTYRVDLEKALGSTSPIKNVVDLVNACTLKSAESLTFS